LHALCFKHVTVKLNARTYWRIHRLSAHLAHQITNDLTVLNVLIPKVYTTKMSFTGIGDYG